jgi:hypothetical protein
MVRPFGNQHASNDIEKSLYVQHQLQAKALTALTLALGSIQFLSLGPEDCEPSVELEDFGKGGVGVEVESEYDLELRIDGNVGRPGMGTPELVDGPNSVSRSLTHMVSCQ